MEIVSPCTGVPPRVIKVSPRYVVGKDGDRYVTYCWEGAEIAVIQPAATITPRTAGDQLERYDALSSNGPLVYLRR